MAGFVAGRGAFAKGYAAEYRHEYAAAIVQFDLALSKPITRYWRTYAFENRAYCYQELQRRAEAIRDYSDALRSNPDLSEARAGRGVLYEEAGQKDLALDDYNEAIRLNPNLPRALYCRGMIYMAQAAYEKARSDFREAIRSFPNFEAAYVEAAFASRNLHDRNGAMSGFEVALTLNPRDARAHAGRASLYYKEKEYARAEADLDEAIRLAPKNLNYRFSRSAVYDYEKRPSESIADLTEVLRLDPRNEEALLDRGVAYRTAKDYSRSLADFTELIRVTQEGGAYRERARTYFRSGNYTLALADYKQASGFPGGTVRSRARPLAWLLATCPDPQFRNGAEAVAQAMKDCEPNGCHDALRLDTLAAAYAEAGKFGEAVRYERQALDLNEGDAEWRAELEKRMALYQERQPYREELKH